MADDARTAALADLTPLQRLEWLEQTLDMLRTSEALAADRDRRRLAASQFMRDGS